MTAYGQHANGALGDDMGALGRTGVAWCGRGEYGGSEDGSYDK